jgi:peptidoglycan/LPS O-acetylase OafA/YrhL
MNWRLIFNQQSYFDPTVRPSLVQNLWSLAIEEQFYLVWPVLFTVGMRYLRRAGLLLATLAAAALSIGLMALLYQPGADPSRLYYGTDTRAAGLLLGAALAFVWTPRHPSAAPGPDGRPRSPSETTVLGHIGGYGGFRSAVWSAPKSGITIALGANQAATDPNILATKVFDAVLTAQGL